MGLDPQVVKQGFQLMEAELALGKDIEVRPSQDAEKIARWSMLFSTMSPEKFMECSFKAITSRTFFPKVSEFQELAFGNLAARAELAFDLVRRKVSQHGGDASFFLSDVDGDGFALFAMQAIGLDVLRAGEPETRSFLRRDFVNLYKAAVSEQKWLEKISGLFECQNTARGFDMSDPALYGRSVLSCPPELREICAPALEAAREAARLPAPAEAPLLEMRKHGSDSPAEDSEAENAELCAEPKFGRLLEKMRAG